MDDGSNIVVTSQSYVVGPQTPVALRVPSGTRVTLLCEDASGGQIWEGQKEDLLDKERLFPVTGVVAIDGVEPGDAVGIELLSITASTDVGTIWTRTGLGLLDEITFHVRNVGLAGLSLDWLQENIKVTSALHVGTAGVLPRNPCLGKDLGGHGGNIDFKRFGVGATLWLAAQTPGGNVFVGDVHAAMGDGEVCGTGVEISAAVDVRLSALTSWSPRLPTVTAEGGAWLIGIGDSLAVSSLLIVQLCQVVNSSSSVAVTLSGGLSGLLGPDLGAQTTISRDEA